MDFHNTLVVVCSDIDEQNICINGPTTRKALWRVQVIVINRYIVKFLSGCRQPFIPCCIVGIFWMAFNATVHTHEHFCDNAFRLQPWLYEYSSSLSLKIGIYHREGRISCPCYKNWRPSYFNPLAIQSVIILWLICYMLTRESKWFMEWTGLLKYKSIG